MIDIVLKKETRTTTGIESCVLQMLAYFSIFHYPLTKDEIKKFLPPGSDTRLFENALTHLTAGGPVFKIDEFYLLQNDSTLVERRREGNLRAEKLLPKALSIGKFLFKFPYVRGIGISGSLSKMYADEKADIDFFVVTKANRLWIARTIMHFFKKLMYLKGRQHFYCMNYYVDERALNLKEQNIYTAIETITLLPVRGKGISEFIKANDWVSKWFAGYHLFIQDGLSYHSGGLWVKRIMEWICNNRAGNRLDDWLMNVTTRRWKRKQQQGKQNHEGKEMALVTGKHFARSNPGFFQEKLLAIYDEKISEMKAKWPKYFQNSVGNVA